MGRILTVFILIFCSLLAASQEEQKNTVLQYSVGLHQASILIHNKDLSEIKNSYPVGIQLEVAWQQWKHKSWDKYHCFPKMGLSVFAWDYDQPEIIGQGLSAIFFIEPEYRAWSTISLSVKGGFGLGYLSKKYDEVDNPFNQAYSTDVSFAVYLAFKSAIRVSPRSKIDLGLYFNHNSNGGISQPNRGLNYPSIGLGYSYYVREPEFQHFNRQKWDGENPKKRLDVSPFVSWKQFGENVQVVTPGIEIKGSRQFGKINAVTLGAEYLHDNFLKYLKNQEGESVDPSQLSTAIGHEFLLGKLIFSQQIGAYLYKPVKEGADLYQRYGLTYQIFDFLAIGLNLKAHGHVAYLVDYRLTYSFHN